MIYVERKFRDDFPLARLLILLLAGAFFGLMIDVRVEHVDAVRDRVIAWMPIMFAGLMTVACLLSFALWSRKTTRVMPVLFLASVLIGGVGFYFHTQGNLMGVMTTSFQAWTDSKMHHLDGPPQLAPLAFTGLGVLGILASTQRFDR